MGLDRVKHLESAVSSSNQATKHIFQVDSDVLETVSIDKNDGKDIVCVPTQTNCRMGCSFCHLTGIKKKTRNLGCHEIDALIESAIGKSPLKTEKLLISFMGSGEPLKNVEGMVWAAMFQMHRRKEGATRFACASIIPNRKDFNFFLMAVKVSHLDMKFHWSLHSTKPKTRKSLMPSALPIQEGMQCVLDYLEVFPGKAEIHYTLIDGVNDGQEDIDGFDSMVDRKVPIKLLRFAEKNGGMVESRRVNEFKSSLEALGFTVETYAPPGHDIQAACGQFVLDRYVK